MQIIERQYPGHGPFTEVWFVEFTFGNRGLWCRYTLSDGPGKRQVDMWGMWFDEDGVKAFRDAHDLSQLGGSIFELGPHVLTQDRAVGSAGEVSWDLALSDGGLVHRHIPGWLFRGKGMRKYVPAMLDLRCSGTVTVAGETFEVSEGRGVMGHIWGKSTKTNSIAWAHCNTFDEGDAVFEALSVRLKLGPVITPTLSSFALHVDGRHYGFSSFREWLRNESRYGDGRWSFVARRGRVSLTGEMSFAPDGRQTHVHYVQHDGGDMYCSNGRFSPLTLHLRDPDHGVDRTLTSRACAFELQSKERPSVALHVP